MTDDELAEVPACDLRTPAEAARELADRQLAALRLTFPAWTIKDGSDLEGRPVWTAHLIRLFTHELAIAGAVEVIERDTPFALAAELSCQAALLYRCRYLGCLPTS